MNGQRGIDTVAIDFDLDLTRVADTVFRNIETIDLRDGSGQELALSAADVLAMTDSRRHCTILADQHDTIRLVGNWTAGATSFNTTAYSLDGATLFVDNTDHILIA